MGFVEKDFFCKVLVDLSEFSLWVFFFVVIFWCLGVSRAGRIVEEDGGTDGSEVGNGERRNDGTQARRERVAVGAAAAAAAAERVVVTAVDEEETTVVTTVGRSSARDGERAT